eukprot:TRINITY_DN25250_c0_g1_i1.p1 TRINITY_DN25250_c0_g1~~TRINITY_DN25250_c0_g1_i1.p1  ORF type:complete len:201 (+),score=30.54 TRINITY_DN25250_c0_g1_i1:38-640(+)
MQSGSPRDVDTRKGNSFAEDVGTPAALPAQNDAIVAPDATEVPLSKFDNESWLFTSRLDPSSMSSTDNPRFRASSSMDENASGAVRSADHTTTVYVSDLPCKVGHERMMMELKALGLNGWYDCMHFPVKKDSFVGYGFIRFLSEDAASYFMTVFQGHRFDDIGSDKVVRVERSHKDFTSVRRSKTVLYDPAGLKGPEESV